MARTELVERRAHNAKHFRNDDGTNTGVFSVGSIHYRATPGGPWLDKRQAIKSVAANEWTSDESDVTMRVYLQASTWWLEFKETLTGVGVRFKLPFAPTVDVGSDTITVSAGNQTWSYTHTPAGGKLLGPLTNNSSTSQTYQMDYDLLGGAPAMTVAANGDLVCGNVFRMSRPIMRGADGVDYDASAWGVTATRISFTWDDRTLPPAAFPYRVDPTTSFAIAASGNDSLVRRDDATTYPPTGAPTWFPAAVSHLANKAWTGSIYRLDVGLLQWDTSSLTSNAVVSAANLRYYLITVDDNENRSWLGQFAAWDGSSASDWVETVDGSAWNIDMTSIVGNIGTETSHAITSGALGGISKTGTTYLKHSISGGQPTLQNRVNIEPFDGSTAGAIKPTLEVTYTTPTIERQTPTTGGVATNLNGGTYDATKIDDDPDTPGAYPGDWLTGTDPSGSGASNGPERADASVQANGLTATTLTTEANVYDGNDATAATHATPTRNASYGRFFTFNAADWSDIPANATITGFTIRVRLGATASNRIAAFFQLGTASNALIGSEGQADGGTNIAQGPSDFGANLVPALGVVPTRAQLITGTFGIQVRW
jgi:hypothetical protein